MFLRGGPPGDTTKEDEAESKHSDPEESGIQQTFQEERRPVPKRHPEQSAERKQELKVDIPIKGNV